MRLVGLLAIAISTTTHAAAPAAAPESQALTSAYSTGSVRRTAPTALNTEDLAEQLEAAIAEGGFAAGEGWLVVADDVTSDNRTRLKRRDEYFLVDGEMDTPKHATEIPSLTLALQQAYAASVPTSLEAAAVVALVKADEATYSTCTATLISPGWALTAAHCIEKGNVPVAILIGETIDDTARTYRIEPSKCHIRPRSWEDTGPACGSLTRDELRARGTSTDLALLGLVDEVPASVATPRLYAGPSATLGGSHLGRIAAYGATEVEIQGTVCTATQRSARRLAGFFRADADGSVIRLSPIALAATMLAPIVAPGDSGGPVFSTLNSTFGREVIVGVVSTTDCHERHTATALSLSHAVWIERLTGVAPWSPPAPKPAATPP
jgi:hypothetical protein